VTEIWLWTRPAQWKVCTQAVEQLSRLVRQTHWREIKELYDRRIVWSFCQIWQKLNIFIIWSKVLCMLYNNVLNSAEYEIQFLPLETFSPKFAINVNCYYFISKENVGIWCVNWLSLYEGRNLVYHICIVQSVCCSLFYLKYIFH
jgi:hypothetical protein